MLLLLLLGPVPQILGPHYKAELLKWVDEASLMERFGGSSTGSLADDVGPWNDPQLYVSTAGLDGAKHHGTHRLRCRRMHIGSIYP